MRIAILHLSDFHFKSGDRANDEKIGKLVDALSIVNPFDECMVIFSGDMTYHGERHEYSPARYTLRRIISQIRTRHSTPYVPLLCIPGNHDLKLTPTSRTHSDIRNYYDTNIIDQQLDAEFAAMDTFFSEGFSDNKSWHNKLLYRYFANHDNYKIQINLLNTAPFSTLKPDDKECHYFPRDQLHLLHKRDESNICITVMHHGIEWFDWSCKADLEKVIYDNSEFLFTGHDHIGSGRSVSFSNDSGVWVSAAGSMDFAKYTHEDSFNLVIIDTDTNCFSGYIFTWNPADRLFYHKAQIENKTINSKSQRLQPRSSYLKELKVDARRKITSDFTDYFVFPRLTAKGSYERQKEKGPQDFDEFYAYLDTHPVLEIDGESNSGKSTLLKYLYLRIAEKGIPLFWDAGTLHVAVRNLVKNLLPTQYGEEPVLHERFLQSPISTRYLLVDNWDQIKEKDRPTILKQLQEIFGHIVLGRNLSFGDSEIDIEECVRESLLPTGDSSILCIEPFFLAKRTQLVRNICLATSTLNEIDIEQVNNAINALVQNHASMFILNPEFIIQYTLYFSREENYCYQKGEQIFGVIFEHNIRDLIISNTSTDNVPEYLTALEEIAYKMHKNRQSSLATSELVDTIETYNRDYTGSIQPRKFLEVMYKAKIFQYVGEGFTIAFSNRNYLSYFVARYICRDITNSGNFDDILDCAKYICYGINADILLFVTYLSSNTRIVKEISSIASNLILPWDSLKLDASGMQLITQLPVNLAKEIKEPTEKETDALKSAKEVREETIHDNTDISTRGIYEYDSDQYNLPAQQIQRGYAYAELLAKALPAFRSILRTEQKEELVEHIYTFPARIAHSIIEPIDRNIDELTEKMYVMAKEMFDEKVIKKCPTSEEIKQILSALGLSIALSVMDHFAECSVDTKTAPLLCSRTTYTETDCLQRLLVLENSGNTDALYKYAQSLLKEYKLPHMQAMIKLVVKKHLLTHSIPYDKRMQITDTIFGKGARKELAIPQLDKAI